MRLICYIVKFLRVKKLQNKFCYNLFIIKVNVFLYGFKHCSFVNDESSIVEILLVL